MAATGSRHSQTESVCGVEAAERSLAGIDSSFVRNLALTSLRLGICHLHRDVPDVDRGAAAIAGAARLAAHNRSVRLVERLQSGWRELEPWHDTPAVENVRDHMLAYGIG